VNQGLSDGTNVVDDVAEGVPMRLFALLALITVASGCGPRIIYHVRGCDERLAHPYKRMECRACVERPRPHMFMPENVDGQRCVLR
jgi:hypothetical protein